MLTILFVMVITGVALISTAVQKRIKQLQGPARGLLISYFTIMLILAVGEGYFRLVYAESDGLPTLASRNWLSKYWQTNSLGYRDIEWQADKLASRKTILVVGDSFTAGWGIPNPQDRFSNVLADKLGDTYAVINIGKEGSNTVDETDHLQQYPLIKVDLVILQYYLNDIENAALSIGLDPKLDPTRDMPSWVNDSYLANFIYWRLVARLKPEQQGTQTYWNWLYSMYDNSTVWDIHQRQIKQFTDIAAQKGAKLMVVIFPNMLDPFASIPYVDRVAQELESEGLPSNSIIKLFDDAAAMPLEQRIVSDRDAHASVAFNKLVGEKIYERIAKP